MLILDAEKRTQKTIHDHFDALLVELLGVHASGLTEPRIRDLIERGILDLSSIDGLDIAELENDPLNPILFTRLIDKDYALASSQERQLMRTASLDYWRKQAGQIKESLPVPPPEQKQYINLFDRAKPPAKTNPRKDAIPDYFSEAEKISLLSAFESVGGFIRGLGNAYADDLSASFYEKWDGENLLATHDPKKRQEALQVIREEVGIASLQNDTVNDVAGKIRQRTKDLARNFERIAETELQATHNEGMIYESLYLDGDQARVARIPETTACKHCKAHFLDSNGVPIVFEVSELIANGTNVGKRASEYKPTAYPMHPHCRCDTIPVPQGLTVDENGVLVKEVQS
tara:strand:- start:158 stop:1192 length:1035 start_codon:yes stop_codon:yes gene_type:complete